MFKRLTIHYYRSLKGVRGFTRETLSALLVDIESRQWHRVYNQENYIPPEHPRASTSDNVESFFQCTQRHGGEGFHSQRGIMISIFTGNQDTCVYITLKNNYL